MHQPEIKKQAWTCPKITDINTDAIKQQEEEALYQLLSSDEGFRLMNGSVTSDYRLKEDKKDFDALEVVQAINAYDFAWKETKQREFGFIAHELQAVLPYVVTGEKNQLDKNGQPIIQRVNYAKLTPILLKAIQQQQETIEKLQEEIAQINSTVLAFSGKD